MAINLTSAKEGVAPPPLLRWDDAFDLDGDGIFGDNGVADTNDKLVVGGLDIVIHGDVFTLSGHAEVSIAEDFIAGSAGFEISRRTVDVNIGVNYTNAELTRASLLTIALTDFQAAAGGDEFGVSVGGGSLAIALLAPKQPKRTTPATAPTDAETRRWIAVVGSGLTATVNGGDLFSASLSDVALAINLSSAKEGLAPPPLLRWDDAFDLDGDGIFGDNGVADTNDKLVVGGLDIVIHGDVFTLSGHAEVSIAEDFIAGSAGFEISRRTVDVNIGVNYTNAELTRASLLTIALTDFQAAAGGDEFGVSVGGGSLAIALLAPKQNKRTTPATPPTDAQTRRWIAVVGSGLTATLNGGELLTASLSDVALAINMSSAKEGVTAPPLLRWDDAFDLDGDGIFGDNGIADTNDKLVVGGLDIVIHGDVFTLSGTAALRIADFVYLSGSVAITRGAPLAVTLEDPDGAGPLTAATDNVNGLLIGASNVRAFVGLGGPYFVDSDNDGDIDGDDTPEAEGATGIVLNGVSFALAMLRSTTVPTREYLALKALATQVALIGVGGATLSASELEIAMNGATNTAAPAGSFVGVIDFSKLAGGGLTIQTGPDPDGAGSQSAPSKKLDATGRVLQVSGRVTLGVAGVVLGTNIVFEQLTRPDDTKVVRIAIGDLDLDIGGLRIVTGNPTLPGIQEANGVILLGGAGMAAKFTLRHISFALGDSSNGVSLNNADLELTLNTGPVAVNETFTGRGLNVEGIDDDGDGAIDEPGEGLTLAVPAGPYLRLAANNVDVTVTVLGISVALRGSFVFEQATLGGVRYTRIGAANVSINDFSAKKEDGDTIAGATLTNGSGALLIKAASTPGGTDGGVAGGLRGDFALSAGVFDASATVVLKFNTMNVAIDQTVVVAGQSIRVQALPRSFVLAVSNVNVSFGDFLTLSGDFAVDDSQPGKLIYGARNVEIFIGSGPYRFEDGTINAAAVGIVVTGATVGAVKFLNGPDSGDDRSAIYAFGTLQLVGLEGIAVSASVRVLINETGRVVTDIVGLPGDGIDNNLDGVVDEDNEPGEADGIDNNSNGTIDEPREVAPRRLAMPFTSAASVVAVETGINSFGIVDPAALLTFDFAGLVKLRGAVRFTKAPTGRIEVDIPAVEIELGIPVEGGTQELLTLKGSARFSFGGGLGFVLQDFRVSGFEVLGQSIVTFAQNIGAARAPSADLAQPSVGSNVSLAELNARGYIEVVYQPLNVVPGGVQPVGLDVASITDSAQEFLLVGAAASGVTVNGAGTQVDSDPYRYRYTFTGSFQAGTDPSNPTNTVTVVFVAGSFADAVGAQSVADSEQFNLFGAGAAATAVPVAQLASPFNGATLTASQFVGRPWIDVTFLTNGLGALDESTIDGDELRLTGAGTANFELVTKHGLPGFVPGTPTKINATTWRYFLTPRTTGTPPVTSTTLFVDGAISVEFLAAVPGSGGSFTRAWRVKTPGVDLTLGTADDGTASPGRGQGTITVSSAAAGAASTASTPVRLGPLSFTGFSIGLAGFAFQNGKLNLTVSITVQEALLAFGSSAPAQAAADGTTPQSTSGISVKLTGLVGKFGLTVDVLALLPLISGGASAWPSSPRSRSPATSASTSRRSRSWSPASSPSSARGSRSSTTRTTTRRPTAARRRSSSPLTTRRSASCRSA